MHIAKNNNEKEFKIWGSGKPLREFLYVEDLSKATLLIHKDTDEDILNVGSGQSFDKELAIKIKAIIILVI